MGWKNQTAEVRVWTEEELLKKESTWYSAYNELERWTKDLKDTGYVLVAEYSIENGINLYRFELNESLRNRLEMGAPHFQNVIIDTKLPQAVLSETMVSLHKK